MRPNRTPEEIEAVAALAQYLEQVGFGNPEEIETIQDKPDSVFNTSRGRVACEFASIVPDTVLRCYRKKLPSNPVGHLFEFVLPREPHEWTRSIVTKKANLHNSYVERSGTKNIWLLLHTLKGTQGILEPPTDEDMRLMAHGAVMARHRFKRVLYFDGNSITVLFTRSERQTININYNLKDGYPTVVLRYFSAGRVAGLIPGAYGNLELFPALLPVARRQIVPPMDRRFASVAPNVDHELKPIRIDIGNPSPHGTLIPPEVLFPELAQVLEYHACELARRSLPDTEESEIAR